MALVCFDEWSMVDGKFGLNVKIYAVTDKDFRHKKTTNASRMKMGMFEAGEGERENEQFFLFF